MNKRRHRYLCRWNSETRGVVRTRMCFAAQFHQLLYILDCPQKVIPHLLQCRSFVKGTYSLCWAALTFHTLFVMLLLYKTDGRAAFDSFMLASRQDIYTALFVTHCYLSSSWSVISCFKQSLIHLLRAWSQPQMFTSKDSAVEVSVWGGLSPCLFFCISMQRSLMRWMLPRRRTSSLTHRFWALHRFELINSHVS